MNIIATTLADRLLAAERTFFLNAEHGRAKIEFEKTRKAINDQVGQLSPQDQQTFTKLVEEGRKAGWSEGLSR